MWSLLVLLLFATFVTASVLPSTKCYALDKNNRLYDFTKWIGHNIEYQSTEGDYVVRFCKDIQLRSQSGYVNYGRFAPALFRSASQSDFVQNYVEGDLKGCEKDSHESFDMSGRNSRVSVICGHCSGQKSCEDAFGCICNVTSTTCSTNMVLAVSCGSAAAGPKVVKGFTAGFSPRGKEVVDDGITQWGFEVFHDDYSFATGQTSVALYITSPAAVAAKVGKPSFEVKPSKGLTVKLSGSAVNGDAPTTESPSFLSVQWQCDTSSDDPYAVTVTVPVDGFDPVTFVLGKYCGHKQNAQKGGVSGWGAFGVLSCIFILLLSTFCCAGFCYNTRIEHKHGIEAVPGLTTLSTWLNSGNGDGYRQAEDGTPSSTRSQPRTFDSKYGAV